MISAIVFGLPLILAFTVLISGFIKGELDKSDGKDSGIFGWIIAIIIGLVILYTIANSNNIIEFDPRHS
jgi:hypothetical protein